MSKETKWVWMIKPSKAATRRRKQIQGELTDPKVRKEIGYCYIQAKSFAV